MHRLSVQVQKKKKSKKKEEATIAVLHSASVFSQFFVNW